MNNSVKEASPMDIIEKRAEQGYTHNVSGTYLNEAGHLQKAPVAWATILKINDGRLMMLGEGTRCYSSDSGKTWSEPEALHMHVDYAVRLKDGSLGGLVADNGHNITQDYAGRGSIRFCVSYDEGMTWIKKGLVIALEANVVYGMPAPYPCTLIQTASGRLILPLRYTFSGHAGMYEESRGWGKLNGKLYPIEGHAHLQEIDIAQTRYSDDGGETWTRNDGDIMVWHKEGYGGMFSCDEPKLVECRNGDVVMFGRTQLDRIYMAGSRAYNSLNVEYFPFSIGRKDFVPGDRFDVMQPTELASTFSPCAVRRIESNGDWLMVWNQVSPEEARGGYRRGRLCSAISKDDGATWEHFRTIDTAGIPPEGRIELKTEPAFARSLDYVGELPDGYGCVDYPNICEIDGTVFLTYTKAVFGTNDPELMQGRLLLSLPLEWLYGEEPVKEPSPSLYIRIAAEHGTGTIDRQIPAEYYKGKFYCKLQDVARYLKSPAGRLPFDMRGTLEQVATCLGWTIRYEETVSENNRAVFSAVFGGANG